MLSFLLIVDIQLLLFIFYVEGNLVSAYIYVGVFDIPFLNRGCVLN